MRDAREQAIGNPVQTAGSVTARPPVADPLRLYKSPEGHHAIMGWYESVLEGIEVPYESLYANTRFGRTHMLAVGPREAPPLFLIPGVAGCAPLWRRQLASLGREFRVYAVDIPGQPGRSDPNPPSFINDDYILWLGDLLDDLDIRRAHFAGVSVGGWLAMRMAVAAPERVLKIVMLAPTGVARARLPVRTWLSRVAKGLRSTDVLQEELTAKNVATTVRKGKVDAFGTFDRQLAKAMALCTKHYRVDRSLGIYDEKSQRIRLLDGLRVLRTFFLAEPDAVLRAVRRPALLVFGEHEVLYEPAKVARRVHRLIEGVRVEVVSGAGHAAIYDKPEVVDPMIAGFLRG